MKVAICTFEYDSIAKTYTSEWVIAENNDKVNDVYVSSSPHVTTEVKYAIGSKKIQELWQQHIAYSKLNQINKTFSL